MAWQKSTEPFIFTVDNYCQSHKTQLHSVLDKKIQVELYFLEQMK